MTKVNFTYFEKLSKKTILGISQEMNMNLLAVAEINMDEGGYDVELLLNQEENLYPINFSINTRSFGLNNLNLNNDEDMEFITNFIFSYYYMVNESYTINFGGEDINIKLKDFTNVLHFVLEKYINLQPALQPYYRKLENVEKYNEETENYETQTVSNYYLINSMVEDQEGRLITLYFNNGQYPTILLKSNYIQFFKENYKNNFKNELITNGIDNNGNLHSNINEIFEELLKKYLFEIYKYLINDLKNNYGDNLIFKSNNDES